MINTFTLCIFPKIYILKKYSWKPSSNFSRCWLVCAVVSPKRNTSNRGLSQAVPWQEYPSWAADEMCDLPVPGGFVGPVAVVDGYVLEAPPFQAWEQGKEHSDVPLVVGTTEQEVDFR